MPDVDRISIKVNPIENNILQSRNHHDAVPAIDKPSTAASPVENRRNPSRAAQKGTNNAILLTVILSLVGQDQAYFIPTNRDDRKSLFHR